MSNKGKKLVSSKFFIYLIIILLSTIFNYYSDFSFLLDVDSLVILWLLFYCIILPIRLMWVIRDKTPLKWYIFVSYLFSVLISGIDFFDFNKFRIEGGQGGYIFKTIFFTCIISSFISLVVFHCTNRYKKNRK